MSTQIHQKDAILNGLNKSFISVEETMSNFDIKEVFQSKEDKWSIAQQFQHLILSNFPVASALKHPYERLASFGTPTDSSLDYEGLKTNYYNMLATGAKAMGPFVPGEMGKDDWNKMFNDWTSIGQKFQARLAEWSESDLDKYVIPHPILGPLSVRQMLFFTILHNQHHLERIK